MSRKRVGGHPLWAVPAALVVLFLAALVSPGSEAHPLTSLPGDAVHGMVQSRPLTTITPTPSSTPICPVRITTSISQADPTQAGMVSRLFTPSVCLPSRSCPGVADSTPRHYKAYTFRNPSGSSQCITVHLDVSGCPGNLYSVGYRNSFDPISPCTNFAGDTGDAFFVNPSYGFMVGGSAIFVVVVHELLPDTGCGTFTLTVSAQGACITTPTPTVTNTPTSTPTFTPTPATQAMLVGQVIWQGRPAPPHSSLAIPVTLTLKSGATEVNYTPQYTDPYGYFTVTVSGMVGTYNWRVDDISAALHTARYLANAGMLTLTGAPTTHAGFGLMRAGDATDDNIVNASDFVIVRNAFGCAPPGCDERADFNGDTLVNASDFSLLRTNFGTGGAPPIRPGSR